MKEWGQPVAAWAPRISPLRIPPTLLFPKVNRIMWWEGSKAECWSDSWREVHPWEVRDPMCWAAKISHRTHRTFHHPADRMQVMCAMLATANSHAWKCGAATHIESSLHTNGILKRGRVSVFIPRYKKLLPMALRLLYDHFGSVSGCHDSRGMNGDAAAEDHSPWEQWFHIASLLASLALLFGLSLMFLIVDHANLTMTSDD
jgi:hypothetical protein